MMIDKKYLFPLILVAINVGAAAMNFFAGDWKKGTYFTASAVCLAVVTFS